MIQIVAILGFWAGLFILLGVLLDPDDLCSKERYGKNCRHRPGECDRGGK
jgi:hypothetical protein